jgi:cation:H+ antiporter
LLTLKSPKGSRLFAVSAKEETETMYYGLFTGSAIPIILFYMGNASRILGIVLVAVFGAYTYWLVRRKQGPNVPSEAQPRPGLKKRLSLAFLGGAVVVVASYFLVDSASSIALFMHVDQAVIGGTIVAFGTSLSVLSASVRAVMKGQADVSLGNVVGSIFVNATLILGASLALWASSVDVTILFNVVLFSALTSVFVWFFLSSDWMNWKVGVVLVFMYFLFLVMSFGGYKP